MLSGQILDFIGAILLVFSIVFLLSLLIMALAHIFRG